MFKKILLAGAALALTMSVATATTYSTGDQTLGPTSNLTYTKVFTNVIGGTYDLFFKWRALSLPDASNTGQTVSFALLGSGSNNIIWADSAAYSSQTDGGGHVFEGVFTLSGGLYSIDLGVDSGLLAKGVNATLKSTPVPGPIAGAGLPVLALLAGVFAFRRFNALSRG
ncbi:MAG: hypothetical protein ACLPN5_20995 [Roseiarcus sp.]